MPHARSPWGSGFRAGAAILQLVNLLFLAFGITGAVGLLIFDVTLGRTRVPPSPATSCSWVGDFAVEGEISAELARRRGALEGERAKIAPAPAEPGADAPARLLSRMKAYFRLD